VYVTPVNYKITLAIKDFKLNNSKTSDRKLTKTKIKMKFITTVFLLFWATINVFFTERDSHVFTCFVDFTKVFDKVNYWKLFNELLDDVILLVCWHTG